MLIYNFLINILSCSRPLTVSPISRAAGVIMRFRLRLGADQTRPDSPLAIMSALAWLLWTLFRCCTLAGPVQHATWRKGINEFKTNQVGATSPSFYHLPMFQHAPRPLVDRGLFRPVPRRPLPAGLTPLLLPHTRQQQQQQSVQAPGARAVTVQCGDDDISVRVDLLQMRAWTVPSLFSLGSCAASRVNPRFLYFHYRLTECGGESKVRTHRDITNTHPQA